MGLSFSNPNNAWGILFFYELENLKQERSATDVHSNSNREITKLSFPILSLSSRNFHVHLAFTESSRFSIVVIRALFFIFQFRSWIPVFWTSPELLASILPISSNLRSPCFFLRYIRQLLRYLFFFFFKFNFLLFNLSIYVYLYIYVSVLAYTWQTLDYSLVQTYHLMATLVLLLI